MDITLGNYLKGLVNEQQVFDFVADNILAQGGPSGEATYNDFSCRYNDEEHVGRHCAAGWLVVDEDPIHVDAVEGSSVYELAETLNYGHFEEGQSAAMDFLNKLQTAHDSASAEYNNNYKYVVRSDAAFLREFKAKMLVIAHDYKLDATSVA